MIQSYINHLRPNGNDVIYAGYTKDENNFVQLKLLVPKGKDEIMYQSYTIMFELIILDDVYGLRDTTAKHEELYLTIYCESKEKSLQLFKNFIKDAEVFCKNKCADKIMVSVYRAGLGWINLSQRQKRNMETIYLPIEFKLKIITNIQDFYDNYDDYHKFGIPHTKKYLFHGPSGTGKLSFIFALASYFDKNIAIINFNQNLDDIALMNCINGLDENTVIVIKDIDTFFVNYGEKNFSNASSVSVGAFISILDGLARKENNIIFMTATDINSLDKSLIVPGKIDEIIAFEQPSKEQIWQIFINYFPNQMKNFDDFYANISHYKITIPLLQKFLFENRTCDNIMTKIMDYQKIIKMYIRHENKSMFL